MLQDRAHARSHQRTRYVLPVTEVGHGQRGWSDRRQRGDRRPHRSAQKEGDGALVILVVRIGVHPLVQAGRRSQSRGPKDRNGEGAGHQGARDTKTFNGFRQARHTTTVSRSGDLMQSVCNKSQASYGHADFQTVRNPP